LSNDTAVTQTDGRSRPEPPHEAPEGRHWVAVPAGNRWRPAQPDKKCRYRGPAPQACGKSAAVVVTRGIGRPIDWNYCAEDALAQYGVWPENGKVMTWELKDDTPEG
jgi:hypothetical protein